MAGSAEKDVLYRAVRPAPLRVQPRPHESRWSLLCRLAEWNESSNVKLFMRGFGLDPVQVSSGQQDADLETITGLPSSAWTDPLPDGSGEFSLAGQGIRSRDYLRPYKNRRICPRCLAADLATEGSPRQQRAYLRHWWSLTFIQTCPEHSVLLADRCSCGRLLRPNVASRTRCRCGQDLTALRCVKVDPEFTVADRYLLGRIGAAEHVPMPLADDLPPGLASGLMRFLGAVERYGQGGPPHVGKIPDLELAELNGRGAFFLQYWPESFWLLMDNLICDAPLRTGTAEEAYGYLHATVHLWIDQADMAPAAKKIAEELVDHALIHVPFAVNSRVLGTPVEGCRLLSLGLAASLLRQKNDTPFFRALNRRNMIETTPSGMRYVRRVKLGQYSQRPPYLTVKEAAQVLGVSEGAVVRLAAAGLIEDLKPGERKVCVDRLSSRDIERLIRKTWPRTTVAETGRLVGIRRAGYIGRLRTPQVLEAMLDGRLMASAALQGVQGIEGLLFDPEHVWDVLRGGREAQVERKRRLKHEAYVRRREAAKAMGGVP